MSFDAVVVGAGPAGLMAARKIAEKGFSVLVCERGRDLGQKACAEGIPDFGFKIAEIPVSKSLISNSIDGVQFFPPDERKALEIKGFYKGYILNKQFFLYALADKAVEAGAELRMQSNVSGIKTYNGQAKKVRYECAGELHEVECKVLVGADGVGSIVSKSCGFYRTGYEVASCLQCLMVNCNINDTNIIRIYLGNEVAPFGYAWIFPKNEFMANVGVGVRSKSADQYLKKFISNHSQFFGKASIIKMVGGLVPVGGQLKEIVRNNTVLCGDAAGQVLPAISGGIWTGMIAGKGVGAAVSEALEAHDLSLLNGYPKKFGKYWGKCIDRSLAVLKIIQKLHDDDFNKLATIINGQDILNLANGTNTNAVVWKLIMHPIFTMKLAYRLLRRSNVK